MTADMPTIPTIGQHDPAWIEPWRDTVRYGDRGRGPDQYDCWGLANYYYQRQHALAVPSYDAEYASSVDGRDIAAVIEREVAAWIPLYSPDPGQVYRPLPTVRGGDLVILRILGYCMHCGIALGPDRFLHLLAGTQVCIERMSSSVWHKRVAGIYRHQALAEVNA